MSPRRRLAKGDRATITFTSAPTAVSVVVALVQVGLMRMRVVERLVRVRMGVAMVGRQIGR